MNEVTSLNLFECLVSGFPRFREDFAEEAALSNFGPVRTYALLRCFAWRALGESIRDGSGVLIDECYRFIEAMLATSDDELLDAVHHELYPALLSDDVWAAVTQSRAGPILAAEIDKYTGGLGWRTQAGGFGAPPQPAPRRVVVEIYSYRSELLLHTRVRRGGFLVVAPPFSRLPAGAEAALVGVTLLTSMNESANYDASDIHDHADEFLRFSDVVSWDLLSAQAVVVQVESSVMRDEVLIWPPRIWRGDARALPGNPHRLPGWDDPEALGQAILDAIGEADADTKVE